MRSIPTCWDMGGIRMADNENAPPEFKKFDAVVGKLLSVPHKELQKREKKYRWQRLRKK